MVVTQLKNQSRWWKLKKKFSQTIERERFNFWSVKINKPIPAQVPKNWWGCTISPAKLPLFNLSNIKLHQKLCLNYCNQQRNYDIGKNVEKSSHKLRNNLNCIWTVLLIFIVLFRRCTERSSSGDNRRNSELNTLLCSK